MDKYNRGSEWGRWDLHIHTASSYDYRYKSEDADKLLCDALKKSGVVAAAITDHFTIDDERIANLKKLAPEITFFPGVELRTDKGSNNLHLIIIFPEAINVKTLSEDFNAIMLREKSKSRESNDTIYWLFEDIVDFSKKHNGVISIHAGGKTNGIDKEISNALPVNEAIKADIAENVDFFEIGKTKDIEVYNEKVFKDIDEKPLLLCSDNHDPRDYSSKESLWIKSNPTFDGLLQCIYQPKERVYIGTVPPALDRANKNAKSNISKISIHQIENPKNTLFKWFDTELELNTGLIAIIGNKGSGKSALSDIIGHMCKCSTMNNASFLNQTRFRKQPKNYANDYISTICWKDGHTETLSLATEEYDSVIENAQYLPQKYIEEVCNDIENTFQNEIDKVIFSYVDKTERGNSKNLQELVSAKSKTLVISIQKIKDEIDAVNKKIIQLEDKKTNSYKTLISDSLKKMEEYLERHIKNKPTEVKKPEGDNKDKEYQKKLLEINNDIEKTEKDITTLRDKLTETNSAIDEYNQLIARIELLERDVIEVNEIIDTFILSHPIEGLDHISIVSPKEKLCEVLNTLNSTKTELYDKLRGKEGSEGLETQLENFMKKKEELISTADTEEKQYQKYLTDLSEWDKERINIIGTSETEESLEYYKAELKFINDELDNIYTEQKTIRDQKTKEIFELKKSLVNIYCQIYSPVEVEIKKLLGELDESIEFAAELQLANNDLGDSLLSFINQKYAGIFKGRTEALNKMNQLIRKTEFGKFESVNTFIHDVMQVVDESIEDSSKKVANKNEFYNMLFDLEYIDVSFKLQMGERNLDELSPGERGIVLLVFYLALSQNNAPIIIDQPEDNLDNQSVFSKLVPCICEAKNKRQVIIVTHNPNIAIACDAEQIIYCNMDKTTHQITYTSGAIENENIRKSVVDVLEGTLPAFALRRDKYFISDGRLM